MTPFSPHFFMIFQMVQILPKPWGFCLSFKLFSWGLSFFILEFFFWISRRTWLKNNLEMEVYDWMFSLRTSIIDKKGFLNKTHNQIDTPCEGVCKTVQKSVSDCQKSCFFFLFVDTPLTPAFRKMCLSSSAQLKSV